MLSLKNPSWAVLAFALFASQISIQSWQLKKQSEVSQILSRFDNYADLKEVANGLAPDEKAALSQELGRIDPLRFGPCEKMDLYDFQTYLRPDYEVNKININVPKNVYNAPSKSGQPLLEREGVSFSHKDSFKNGTAQQATKNLLKVARDYSGRNMTLAGLRAIADKEAADVLSRLERLEIKITEQGLAGSLDEFAADPAHFLSRDFEITAAFTDKINEAREHLMGPFMLYGVPPVQVIILNSPHMWRARASYGPASGTLTLYKTGEAFDAAQVGFLSAHEIMPGHHLQYSAAKEKGGICGQPTGEADNRITEGWATYSEHLADEARFFADPLPELGWLDYRLMRTARIHMDIARTEAKLDKTEMQAIWEGLLPARLHGAFDDEYVRLERAGHHHLSYLLGREAIFRAQKTVKKHHGNALDIRLFHDALLRGFYPDMSRFEEKLIAAMEDISEQSKPPSMGSGQ